MSKTCECADPGCRVHSHAPVCLCWRDVALILYRLDHGLDATGIAFCAECGGDALESGLFVENDR